jgi:hypothetical protein
MSRTAQSREIEVTSGSQIPPPPDLISYLSMLLWSCWLLKLVKLYILGDVLESIAWNGRVGYQRGELRNVVFENGIIKTLED